MSAETLKTPDSDDLRVWIKQLSLMKHQIDSYTEYDEYLTTYGMTDEEIYNLHENEELQKRHIDEAISALNRVLGIGIEAEEENDPS
jgi:hypothetical protein